MKTILARKPKKQKTIAILKHDEASRKNIPIADDQFVMRTEEQIPIQVVYEGRNPYLDPQLACVQVVAIMNTIYYFTHFLVDKD